MSGEYNMCSINGKSAAIIYSKNIEYVSDDGNKEGENVAPAFLSAKE